MTHGSKLAAWWSMIITRNMEKKKKKRGLPDIDMHDDSGPPPPPSASYGYGRRPQGTPNPWHTPPTLDIRYDPPRFPRDRRPFHRITHHHRHRRQS